MAAKKTNPEKTTLDEDTTKPSTTAPGDGPADTTDPNERASSITPQPGPEAINAVHQATRLRRLRLGRNRR